MFPALRAIGPRVPASGPFESTHVRCRACVRLSGSGRVEPTKAADSSPKTCHSATCRRRSLERIGKDRLWPGRAKERFELAAGKRPFVCALTQDFRAWREGRLIAGSAVPGRSRRRRRSRWSTSGCMPHSCSCAGRRRSTESPLSWRARSIWRTPFGAISEPHYSGLEARHEDCCPPGRTQGPQV